MGVIVSAKQIKELQALGLTEAPPSLYPEGWLEWANDPTRRVNLNRASVCVDSRNVGWSGRCCYFIVTGDEYHDRGYHHRNEYRKERINGRPVRVYIGAEPGEAIPF